ncbi:hypothetical protein RB195_022228 [Necator americanus]|uniref:Reverse transcriptase domain-containing protein n=1 Tax=Necator americanus TaxID=51031 RepID=A0ABR1EEQ4_NECAM
MMPIDKSAGLDEPFVSRLKLDKLTCPVFNGLIRTHKLKPDEMNSTSAIPSHLSNMHHFLEPLRNARVESNSVIESFDVTPLYTNVKNSKALQALSEMTDLHGNNLETYGLSETRIITLIKECVNCNIFRWSGNYFAELRGLAMGQRLAPLLAICFMSMYSRYIDGCCTITSTESEMDKCFRILNQQSQYIRLTRETLKEGWHPYLKTQISASNDIIRVKWYRKERFKKILSHAKSAHPIAAKRAALRDMFKTASEVCSDNQERQEN